MERRHARGSFWKGIKGHSKGTLQSACPSHMEGRPGVCHGIPDQQEWHSLPLLGYLGTRRDAGLQGRTSRQLPYAHEQRSPRGGATRDQPWARPPPGHRPQRLVLLSKAAFRQGGRGPLWLQQSLEDPRTCSLCPEGKSQQGRQSLCQAPDPCDPCEPGCTGVSRDVTCLRSESASGQRLLGVEAGSFAGK